MVSYVNVLRLITQMQDQETRLRAHLDGLARAMSAQGFGGGGPPPMTAAQVVEFMNANRLREKHAEWGRKLEGVAAGYAREMQGGTKAAFKGRALGFDNADLTVGAAEPYAKAVQYKHTISPDASDVDAMIAKAANQLTGESGETPLATQRKAIDMMINEDTNSWPFNPTDFADYEGDEDINSGIVPLAYFLMRAGERVHRALATYRFGNKGLNPATLGSLYSSPHAPPVMPGPHAVPVLPPGFVKPPGAGPKSSALAPPGGTKEQVLTVKITFGSPRKLLGSMGAAVEIRQLNFAVYRTGPALQVVHVP